MRCLCCLFTHTHTHTHTHTNTLSRFFLSLPVPAAGFEPSILWLWVQYFTHRHQIKKIDWWMPITACLVCLASTTSGCHKNTFGSASASSGHIAKLEQSTFLRYLWFYHSAISASPPHRDSKHTLFIFSSFEHAKNLLIMGPNNTKTHQKVWFFFTFNYE